MSYSLNRINPNQTQIFFADGRFETVTDEELEDFLQRMGAGERDEGLESSITD